MIGFQLLRLFFSALASVVIGVCASMHLGEADMTNCSVCVKFLLFNTLSHSQRPSQFLQLQGCAVKQASFLCVHWEWFILIMLNSHCFQHEVLHQKRQVVKCLTSSYWEFSLPPSDLL